MRPPRDIRTLQRWQRLIAAGATDATKIGLDFKRPPSHWTEIRNLGIPNARGFEYGGFRVLSSLAFARGADGKPTPVPQWSLSILKGAGASSPTDRDVARVLTAFKMEGATEATPAGYRSRNFVLRYEPPRIITT